MNWNRVVEDLGPRLFRYFSVRFSAAESDDLTQETLIRLVRKVEERIFDPELGSLRMFAFGIAHFVALEHRRLTPIQAHEDLSDEIASDSKGAEEFLINEQNVIKLRQKMSMLSDKEQQILSLMVDEDMGPSAIAIILQIPEGTVKSHIHRAKVKLFQLMSQEDQL